jgi:xylulokinase
MYNIGYDIGSSSIKAALVEVDTGKQIAVTHEPEGEMGIISSQSSWAEQDPKVWWELVCLATKKLLKQTGIDPAKISGIGIAYQMHGLVVVDRSGAPLRNAIIWCDSRAVDIGNEAFKALGTKKCREHLLNSPANFTASKLKWVHDNEPDIYEKIYKYMLPGDYIAYKFSGDITTTINGLSEGTLWDYKNHEPANWLLSFYNLNPDTTPDLVDNFSVQAKLNQKGAEASGLKLGTPITYRAGDQPNNALSLNVIKPGEVAATGGTSGVVYALTENKQTQELERINHFAHVNYSKENPVIGKLLCINGSGILYRWMRNNTGVNDYNDMNLMTAQVPIGSHGLCVMPFGNGAERMLGNKNIGARILNLNLNQHNQDFLYRAALEGIAFSFIYGMTFIKNDNTPLRIIRAGNDNLFRSEVFGNTIATMIGQEIEIFNTTGAVGAARAASMDLSNMDLQSTQDYSSSYTPQKNKEVYLEAYSKFEKELKDIINKH